MTLFFKTYNTQVDSGNDSVKQITISMVPRNPSPSSEIGCDFARFDEINERIGFVVGFKNERIPILEYITH